MINQSDFNALERAVKALRLEAVRWFVRHDKTKRQFNDDGLAPTLARYERDAEEAELALEKLRAHVLAE
jgi:hypothetical protein